jgi:hypothetical protein
MRGGGFIGYPTGWLLAVSNGQLSAEKLERLKAEVSGAELTVLNGAEAADRFDGLGRTSGRRAWWRRAMQQLSMDQMPDFLWYEEALRRGDTVVAIRATDSGVRRRAAAALAQAGGHFINYFGSWSTEAIAPWRGPEPPVPQIMRR